MSEAPLYMFRHGRHACTPDRGCVGAGPRRNAPVESSSVSTLQGYLAHKKTHHPRILPQAYA
jgi:hypothetical protein